LYNKDKDPTNIGSNGQTVETLKSDIKIHTKSNSFNFPIKVKDTYPVNKPNNEKDLDKLFNDFIFDDKKHFYPTKNDVLNIDGFNFNNNVNNNLDVVNNKNNFSDNTPQYGHKSNDNNFNINSFNFIEDESKANNQNF
jgi:hypothetical protein